GLFAFAVEIDVAQAHVHRGLAVGPHHLGLERHLRVEIGEVEDEIDDRTDLLDARALDADSAQRDVLDLVIEQHFAAGVVDVRVDLVPRLARPALSIRHANPLQETMCAHSTQALSLKQRMKQRKSVPFCQTTASTWQAGLWRAGGAAARMLE